MDVALSGAHFYAECQQMERLQKSGGQRSQVKISKVGKQKKVEYGGLKKPTKAGSYLLTMGYC